MTMMLSLSILLLLLLLTSGDNVSCDDEEEAEVPIIECNLDEAVQNMIQWMQSNGGFLDPRVEIRRVDPSDPSSFFGIFANAPIREDEIILKIPDSLKIKTADDDSEDDDDDWEISDMVCDLSWRLWEEFEKGDESKYLPYINYLRLQEKGQIPGAWSAAGKDLLLQVQGDLRISDRNEEEASSVEYLVDWLYDYSNEDCLLNENRLDPHFIALAVQRGYDSVMVPIYDMINHSNNPKKRNIIAYSNMHDDKEFVVHALRDIQAGEELLYSYDTCPDCEDTADYWGTPELLRDFGFVEEYPHVYYISPVDDSAIFVEEVETEDAQVRYKSTCLGKSCPEKDVIQEKVQNLKGVEKSISDAVFVVPERELAVIRHYHNALLVAYSSL